MSEQDTDQPISEDDLARMFDEEEGAQPVPATEPVDEQPPPEIPEPIVAADEPEEPQAAEVPPAEPVETPVEPEAPSEEHLEWAQRRNLMSFEEASKLAYEQERFLGRRATEAQEARQRIAELEEELRTAQATAPVQQTRTDEWIQQAVLSPDPSRYALELAAQGQWADYEQLMQTWEGIVGETVTVGVHQQIMGMLERQAAEQNPNPEVQSDAQRAIADGFAQAGVYDMQTDPVMAKVREIADGLGGNHPIVLGAARGDAVAITGLVEIARAQMLTTRTLRVTEPDPARPEQTGEGLSPTRTPPQEDPFGEMEEEWRRMGVLPVTE